MTIRNINLRNTNHWGKIRSIQWPTGTSTCTYLNYSFQGFLQKRRTCPVFVAGIVVAIFVSVWWRQLTSQLSWRLNQNLMYYKEVYNVMRNHVEDSYCITVRLKDNLQIFQNKMTSLNQKLRMGVALEPMLEPIFISV